MSHCSYEPAPRASICIAAYDKPNHLDRTLFSIFQQRPSFPYEVIVVDDGSPTYRVENVCWKYPLAKYIRIARPPGYRNPSVARNEAYRRARGEIVICQSDDVYHVGPSVIQNLVDDLKPGHFLIATVTNVDESGSPYCDPTGQGYGDGDTVYTSPQRNRPLFFLGSLYRRNLYAVGGNDEEFVAPGREDVWFSLCLMKGLGLRPIYSERVIGYHQHHPHCDPAVVLPSQEVFARKLAQRPEQYVASGGPWEYPEEAANPPPT